MTATQPTTWTILDEAHAALRSAVAGVPAAEWTAPTPCEQWSVTQVLQHAAGDQLGYAAAITGGPGPSENPFAPSGRLYGAPADLLEPALAASRDAYSRVEPGTPDVPNPLPQGPLPAETAAGACALDAAIHAWDIAVATSQPSPVSPALAARLMPTAAAIVEPLRQYGAYAAALTPDTGDDDLAALLRYLGRDPGWTATPR